MDQGRFGVHGRRLGSGQSSIVSSMTSVSSEAAPQPRPCRCSSDPDAPDDEKSSEPPSIDDALLVIDMMSKKAKASPVSIKHMRLLAHTLDVAASISSAQLSMVGVPSKCFLIF
jgi:hypothetical protein